MSTRLNIFRLTTNTQNYIMGEMPFHKCRYRMNKSNKTNCIGSNDDHIFGDFIVIAMVLQTPLVIICSVT